MGSNNSEQSLTRRTRLPSLYLNLLRLLLSFGRFSYPIPCNLLCKLFILDIRHTKNIASNSIDHLNSLLRCIHAHHPRDDNFNVKEVFKVCEIRIAKRTE